MRMMRSGGKAGHGKHVVDHVNDIAEEYVMRANGVQLPRIEWESFVGSRVETLPRGAAKSPSRVRKVQNDTSFSRSPPPPAYLRLEEDLHVHGWHGLRGLCLG